MFSGTLSPSPSAQHHRVLSQFLSSCAAAYLSNEFLSFMYYYLTSRYVFYVSTIDVLLRLVQEKLVEMRKTLCLLSYIQSTHKCIDKFTKIIMYR